MVDVDDGLGRRRLGVRRRTTTRWVVGGGLYYNPVEQLTIGVEGSYWMTAETNLAGTTSIGRLGYLRDGDTVDIDSKTHQLTVDFVVVWRF